MKRAFTFIFFIAFAGIAIAQTPQEIISRMETEITKHENEGIAMSVDLKVPIVGTMTTQTYNLGERIRIEATMNGTEIITWADENTIWMYNSKNNKVKIEKNKANKKSESEGDIEMFNGINDGYVVSIEMETSEVWHIYCEKSKSNKEKKAPKKMNVVVAKGTYMPVSLSTKVSGMDMTMRNISFGVTEKQVTFNPKDYPGVTIVDKR